MSKLFSAFVFSLLVAISAIIAAPADYARAAISLTPVPKSFDPARPSAISTILNADLAIIQSGVAATVGCTGASGVSCTTNGSITDPRLTIGINPASSITAASFNGGIGLQSAHVADSVTAPTIASGFGTSPSIVASNGTAAFILNIGTGGTATSGVVAMPTATTGWACSVQPASAPQAGAAMYSMPTSASSVTITNYNVASAVAVAWTSGDIISVQCRGY